MDSHKNYIMIMSIICFFLMIADIASAQGRRNSIPIKVEVTDIRGIPVEYAKVSSSKNRFTYTTDKDGTVELKLLAGDHLKIDAEGYIEKITDISSAVDGIIRVSLVKVEIEEDIDHTINMVTGDKLDEYRNVGAYSTVDGADLDANPTMFLMDALGGRLNGLFIMNQNAAPGQYTWSGFVRAPSGGTPVIMVDGVERSIDYIEPETIESVQLLKDASLKSLFGGVYSNGILMITTKRGKAYENGVHVNVQSGVQLPTRLPDYLNSSEYAFMYNSALQNIGLPPVYNPSEYNGSDPLLYPDVDYYNQFLNKAMTITRANAQLSGGNENTKYFVHLGFQTNGGLEKYTDYPNRDQVLSVRGNIDNKILGFITLRAGLNAAIENRSWPNINSTDFFNILSDSRPNEYPITIPGSAIGSTEDYVLGGTAINRNNPLGKLTRNGYVEREYSYVQTDFTLDIDLNRWVKGLSIRPMVTFDIYNEFSSRKDGGFSVTEILGMNEDNTAVSSKVWGYDPTNTSLVRGSVSLQRNWAFRTVVKWERTFGKHEIFALANYFMQQRQFNEQIHSMRRLNSGIKVNYMYGKKYVVDVSANYVGVPAFAKGDRFGLFPTVGAGWIISGNDFMKNSSWVDYLKLRASYGILGSVNYGDNGIVSNYYYRDEWSLGNAYSFSSLANIATLIQTGNPDADFQKSYEFNAGIDFNLFDNSLSGSVGYFRNELKGGLANEIDATPGVIGKGGALVWRNVKSYLSQGAEIELYYSKRFGNFEMTAGGNFSYGRSEVTKEVDINYPDELDALRKVTVDGDVKGYKVVGVFNDYSDIANSPVQTMGKVYPGDLKYQDMNNDGIIDERDCSVIANTQPSISYGITISLKYKGFNLDILGYGLAGFDRLLTNKYYQIFGDRKYSDVLYTGLPNGNPHPVLRADSSNNNFVNSDYWVVNGGYFKLRNIELGYTLPHKISKKIGLNLLKFFVRGTNLFTVSKIKDLDPEYLSAGVSDYPLFSTITGGLSFSF